MIDIEKKKARQKRYNQSERGKARNKRYYGTEKKRACGRRYNKTYKGKRRRYKYMCEHTLITNEKILTIILSNYGRT